MADSRRRRRRRAVISDRIQPDISIPTTTQERTVQEDSLLRYIRNEYTKITSYSELEAKFSIGNQNNFNNIINPTILNLLSRVGDNHNYPSDNIKFHEETDYIINVSYIESIRYNTYTDTVYQKNRISNETFRNYYPIDNTSGVTVRITLSEEIPDDTEPSDIMEDATLVRDKRRYTAEYRGCTLFLTYVNEFSELEIEAGDDPVVFKEVIDEFAQRIRTLYDVMTYYRSELVGRPGYSLNTRFQGSMPISYREAYNLTRYSVKYKFDGERINLIIFNGRSYLLTRSKGLIFTDIPYNPLYLFSGIYDGELVQSQNDQEYYLVLFDVVVGLTNGNIMNRQYWFRNSILSSDMSSIRNVVKNLIKSPLESALQASRTVKNRLRSLPMKLKAPGAEVSFNVDGLILQSLDSAYETGTDRSMYKWKEQRDITVDYIPISYDNERIELLAGVEEGNTTVTTTTFPLEGDESYDRIDELQRAISQDIVSEFYYDNMLSMWIFSRLREDKNRPNYITVVMDVLESALSYVNIDGLVQNLIEDNQSV